jgi:hypothetical protein
MVMCQLCNEKPATYTTENEHEEKIKYSFSFCRECIKTGTIIVGIWKWKKLHPKYKHPVLDIKKEDNFDDIVKKYLDEDNEELVNWKNY